MKQIWYFGDSFTAGYNSDYVWVNEYIKWKGYKPKHFTELFAEKMALPYTNLGLGGCDNYTIFKTLSDTIEKIGDDDVVVIGWSTTTRGRIVNLDNNEWLTINSHHNTNLKCISTNAILELVSLRDSPLKVEEVLDWQKIIKRALKTNKVVFWSFFSEFNNCNIMDSLYWKSYPISSNISIRDETNGIVSDLHLSEIGNVILADSMWDYVHYKQRTPIIPNIEPIVKPNIKLI